MRFIPAAMTPISLVDVGRAAAEQFRGEPLRSLEETIAQYVGVRGAYSYTSFMRAIYACLTIIAENSPTDKNQVLLSRYSCPSFAHAIHAAGLEPAYCEMIPKTLSIDLDQLERQDFSKVLAVIGVNFFGLSNPADRLSKLCKERGVYYVEGLDYSLGTEYQGKKVGTFGDFGILNFQEGKAIPVSGGMIVTNHTDLMKAHARGQRKQRSSNVTMMCGYSVVTKPLPYYFFMKTSEFVGTNIRKRLSMEDTIRKTKDEFDFTFDDKQPLEQISNFQAKLACTIMDRYESHIAIRRSNAEFLRKNLSACSGIELIDPEPGISNIHYVRFPILVNANMRALLVSSLCKNGIEASTMYSDHGLNFEPSKFPGAARVMDEIVTLPCHPGVEQRDLDKTVAIIKSLTMKQ